MPVIREYNSPIGKIEPNETTPLAEVRAAYHIGGMWRQFGGGIQSGFQALQESQDRADTTQVTARAADVHGKVLDAVDNATRQPKTLDDGSPNPAYIDPMSPDWVQQVREKANIDELVGSIGKDIGSTRGQYAATDSQAHILDEFHTMATHAHLEMQGAAAGESFDETTRSLASSVEKNPESLAMTKALSDKGMAASLAHVDPNKAPALEGARNEALANAKIRGWYLKTLSAPNAPSKDIQTGIDDLKNDPVVAKYASPGALAQGLDSLTRAKTAAIDGEDARTVGQTVLTNYGNKYAADAKANPTTSAPNQAVYINEHRQDILNEYGAQADKIRPGDAVFKARVMADGEAQLNQITKAQDDQNKANLNILDRVAGQTGATSIDQIKSAGPEAATAANQLQKDDAAAFKNFNNKLLPANAKGASATYGAKFYDNLKTVLSGGDSRPMMGLVGTGSQADLTNTGYKALSEISAFTNTPQGRASGTQIANFLDSAHSTLAPSGWFGSTNEDSFNEFLHYAVPAIKAKIDAGQPITTLFDPKSKDYLLSEGALKTFGVTDEKVLNAAVQSSSQPQTPKTQSKDTRPPLSSFFGGHP